ncbi:hypothetical protein [Microcoleus sp. bin38.metabat.b11b12b14.051]|uniref:hypothetical protein n=1 Tax=Microcoleus sp. bin38.metabat.b11b12b14.051 TaxID=2742709 RepID=UPI0025D019F9|nr:hypothetical protein [Microcoleus sp. bin38.metabat.b11b12b14.051]
MTIIFFPALRIKQLLCTYFRPGIWSSKSSERLLGIPNSGVESDRDGPKDEASVDRPNIRLRSRSA